MGSTQILSQLDLIFALRVTLFSVVSVDDANPTVPFLPPAPPPPSAERGSVSRHHAIVITLMISRNILLRVSRARGRVSRGNNAERDRCCTFYTYTYISRTGWTVQPLPRVLLSFFFFFLFAPSPFFHLFLTRRPVFVVTCAPVRAVRRIKSNERSFPDSVGHYETLH